MAIVQISKIIHRTGANTDLPQLDTGEIGFASDEQKVYIGNDPLLHPVPNGQITTQVELLTEVSNIDFSKVTGSGNVVFNVTTLHTGQLVVANGPTVGNANSFINWKGNALGTGSNIKLQLGNVANISITGGSSNQLLTTDGAGNLSWSNPLAGLTLPSQDSNVGKYLTTNGSAASWANVFADTKFANTVRSNISVGYASGYGNLSYSNANGVITFTGPSSSDIRNQFSAGTGVNIVSGTISIGQDVASTANPVFANISAEDITSNTLTAPFGTEFPIVYTGSSKKLVSNSAFNYNTANSTLSVGKISANTDITLGGVLKLPLSPTPIANNAAGSPGQIKIDANYIYVCLADQNWKRVEISAF
jgi:hypothetical protein